MDFNREQCRHHTPDKKFEVLTHVTGPSKLVAIRREGLRAPVYLCVDQRIAEYYAETVRDEKDTPVFLEVDLGALQQGAIEPDYPGLEEPLTCALGVNESEIHAQWQRGAGGWKECLSLIGSCRYKMAIAPENIRVDGKPLVPIKPSTDPARSEPGMAAL